MKKMLFALVIISIATVSCRYMWGKRIRGNGNITTMEHSVGTFKNVEVSGVIDVYVSQGAAQPVRIETDENLQQYVEVINEGDKIIIRNRSGINLRPSHGVKAYLHSELYNAIEVSGACNITGQGKINNAENIKLEVSGAGGINMDLNAPAVTARVTGAGSVNLKGETKDFILDLTGAGKAHCFDLKSENTKVDISGAGNADVYTSVKLDAEVSGAGTVRYKGDATSINQHVSGAGSVRKEG